MTVFLKILWLSFIGFLPLWVGVIAGAVFFFEEKVLGRNFDE